MFGRFFGGKKKDEPLKPPEIDLPEAILRNKEAIEILEKRQVHIEKRIITQDEEAKKRAKEGDKRGALLALKRKKMYEKELEQLGNAHLTLEQQIITLESAQTQQVAVGALTAGVVVQKALNQQLNLSKIDDLMEDLHEQAAMQQELAQVLCQGASLGDDSELLAELHEIEVKQLEEALVDAAPIPDITPGVSLPAQLPTVESKPSSSSAVMVTSTTSSSTSIHKPQLSDEEQLRQLLNEIS